MQTTGVHCSPPSDWIWNNVSSRCWYRQFRHRTLHRAEFIYNFVTTTILQFRVTGTKTHGIHCKKPLRKSPVTHPPGTILLANVNSSSRSLYVIVRPSVVCNVRAPYSDDWNFRQCFYFLRRVPWPFVDIQIKFYGDRPRGTPPSGELNRRGVAEYSDFGPIDGYISETVQDRS